MKLGTRKQSLVGTCLVACALAIGLASCGGGGTGAGTVTTSGGTAGGGMAPIPVGPGGGGTGGGTGTGTGNTGSVSLFAGSPTKAAGNLDGTGTAATFNGPEGIATDGTNIYVADKVGGTIRKIVIATQAVTTIASGFAGPMGLATDGTNLYVADAPSSQIWKIALSTGTVTSLAGGPIGGYADGVGATALFSTPHGVATDGINVYVADWGNNMIRQIVIATGVVTTLAGGAVSTTPGVCLQDGIGSAAEFCGPWDLVKVGGNLYVVDDGNNAIRQLALATNAVTTFAGGQTGGNANGVGKAAQFNMPMGIASDGTNLYVADYMNSQIRQIVISSATVTLWAGDPGGARSNTNGVRVSTVLGTAVAQLSLPVGVTVTGGAAYIADYGNNEIRLAQ